MQQPHRSALGEPEHLGKQEGSYGPVYLGDAVERQGALIDFFHNSCRYVHMFSQKSVRAVYDHIGRTFLSGWLHCLLNALRDQPVTMSKAVPQHRTLLAVLGSTPGRPPRQNHAKVASATLVPGLALVLPCAS